MDTKTAVTALAALAQTSRLAVFRFLVERGPLGANPGELVDKLSLAPATLSFHLKELTHAGLVHAEQLGRFIRYRADMTAMQALVDYLTKNCCAGNPSLCAPAACGPSCAPAAETTSSKVKKASPKVPARSAGSRARATKSPKRAVR
jgi:DNA-binding transcriptional ArsR family regulator